MDDPGQQWIAAMRGGDFARAWAIADAVLAARDPATRDDPALPYHRRWVWDGRAFVGRDMLVRCYHGLGDTLQFARFVPLLARAARSVTVEAPLCLHALLASGGGIDRLIAFDHARPAPIAGCDIEVTELPHALRATPAMARPPYLRATAAALPAGTIGLCYAAGNWDGERSVPPALLAGIAARHRCITLVTQPTDLPVRNPGGCPLDMTATAALVASCALVVTVDTMIAHLAGALGRPTWLLLKAEPDWRWVPGATATPWYPTMRLFAQGAPGDWASAIRAVERALHEFHHESEDSHGERVGTVGSGLLG